MIQSLKDEFLPSSLSIILAEGNPIPYVTLDCDNFQNLTKIECGSTCTKYLSFPLVKRICSESLNFIVPTEYTKHLILPPGHLLTEKDLLSNFVDNPERTLLSIADDEIKIEALTWLTQDSKCNFANLDLDSHVWLNENKGRLSCISLPYIHTLTLTNCKLQTLRIFGDISKIKHLNLCNNNLKTLSLGQAVPSLETLNVAENSITTIDFDREDLPCLGLLTFGSTETCFVSRRVLEEYLADRLALSVPEKYRNKLLRPTWQIITRGKAAVRKYTENSVLDVSHINNISMKVETIHYELETVREFTGVDFTEEKQLCQYFKKEGLSKLFQHPSLKCITYTFLSDCSLNALPNWNVMDNLIFADISGNRLEEIPGHDKIQKLNISKNNFNKISFGESLFPKLTHLQVQDNSLTSLSVEDTMCSLETLNVSNNPIEEINFDAERFTKLKSITFGSDKTCYISNRILNLVIEETLAINVSEQHRKRPIITAMANTGKGITVTERLSG